MCRDRAHAQATHGSDVVGTVGAPTVRAVSSRVVRVAAVQMNSGTDLAANRAAAVRLVSEAADRGATYVQLPEYTPFLGPTRGYAAAAETIPGPTTRALAALARRHRVIVHVGSLLERTDGLPYNTSVVIGPHGRIVARYRKTHLFDVDVPGTVRYRESDGLSRGDELVVAHLRPFDLGLSVCFDVRFPELYRALSARGAEVLAIPAAFNAGTGASHWDVLVRARAIENHAFVVAATQAGVTTEGIATYGHAMIVGPWGDVRARSHGDDPQVVVADIDLDEVARRREQIAVLRFRRPTLYRRRVRIAGA